MFRRQLSRIAAWRLPRRRRVGCFRAVAYGRRRSHRSLQARRKAAPPTDQRPGLRCKNLECGIDSRWPRTDQQRPDWATFGPGTMSTLPRRWRLGDQRIGHCLPRFFVPADAQPIASADQGQAQQLRLPFDAGQNVGIRQAEILETGIDIRFPFCVQEGDQTEAVGEPADLGGGHRPLVQTHHLDRNTPLFEESLSRACAVGFLDSENLDVHGEA